MFKFLIVCSVLTTVHALTLGGCNVTDIVHAGKAIYNQLSPTQLAEIKAINAEAFAPNTTVTKGQYFEEVGNVTKSLNADLQAQIKDLVPTSLPAIPTTMSSAAQTTLQQIESVLTDMTITIPENNAQISQIIADADPAVVTELKSVKLANCD